MKEKIRAATYEMTMKYGIKSVSMDDIAKHMGISKKTIYEHFESKELLISYVFESHICDDQSCIVDMKNLSINAIDEMISIARHVLAFLRGMSPSVIFDVKKYYPEIWNMVEEKHFGFIKEVIQANIERGQKEGLYHVEINAEIIARLYVNMSLSITDENIFPLKNYARADLFKSFITYHIRGLMTHEGRKLASKIEL